MPYSITLRSRIDATITGWYDGSRSRWSTDHKRRRLFDNKREAKSIREELRSLCPRNATAINIETEQVNKKLLARPESPKKAASIQPTNFLRIHG
jgi:hypothetical protein